MRTTKGKRTPVLGVILGLLLACAPRDRPPSAVAALGPERPDAELALTGAGHTPTAADLIVELTPGVFLTTPRRNPELWELRLDPDGHAIASRLVHSFVSLRTRVLSLAVGDTRVAVLESPNAVILLDATDWTVARASVIELLPGERPLQIARGASGWNVLLDRWEPGKETRRRGVIMLADDLTFARRVDLPLPNAPEDPGGLFDMNAFAGVEREFLVSGSFPPRLLRFAAPDRFTVVPFHGHPRRYIPSEARISFEREARGLPPQLRRLARLPPYLPAALSTIPVDGGYLVEAFAGGVSGEARAIDLYCSGTFRRTVFQREDVTEVTLLPSGMAALRTGVNDLFQTLDLYAYAQLGASCP